MIDDDMLLSAPALRNRGTLMPEIAEKATIKTGTSAGKHPSVASLHRTLPDEAASTVTR